MVQKYSRWYNSFMLHINTIFRLWCVKTYLLYANFAKFLFSHFYSTGLHVVHKKISLVCYLCEIQLKRFIILLIFVYRIIHVLSNSNVSSFCNTFRRQTFLQTSCFFFVIWNRQILLVTASIKPFNFLLQRHYKLRR